MQPDGVLPVVGEVARERLVTRVSEVEVVVGRAQTTVVRSELIDHIDAGLGWTVDRYRVAPVLVEVPREWHVARVPEEEGEISVALCGAAA